MPQKNRTHHENGSDLDCCRHVEKVRALASADYIDGCDDEDHRDRDGFHVPRRELNEFSEVISESHRERGN